MRRPTPLRRQWSLPATVLVALATGLLALLAPAAPAAPGVNERISVSSAGAAANAASGRPSFSTDGRLVAFHSGASNLVADDTNGNTDVFVRDRLLGTTTRVSVAGDGTQGNGPTSEAAISGNGRYVTFNSSATNLVAGDTNALPDIFLRDLVAGTTTRISVTTAGNQVTGNPGFGAEGRPAISADGKVIVWQSLNNDLVVDNNFRRDIFVRDLTGATPTTTRANVADVTGVGTGQGNGHSQTPSISADGNRVAFDSNSNQLVTADTNGQSDVFVRDRATGRTYRASLRTDGGQSNAGSFAPALSRDGKVVAFETTASNLGTTTDTDGGFTDIYAHDLAAGKTTWVNEPTGPGSEHNSWQVATNGNRRYVGFYTHAGNVVSPDTNTGSDVIRRDLQTSTSERMNVTPTGAQSNGSVTGNLDAAFDDSGQVFGFTSDATNVVANDTNGVSDVFVRERDLDGDGTADSFDVFPSNPAEQKDADGDGVGDNGDTCPNLAGAPQTDTDNDGRGDACDSTPDGNLVVNGRFLQPTLSSGYNVLSSIPGWSETTGCGIELWSNNFIVPSPYQAQVLELNANCPSQIQQTIATVPGRQYLVTYYFGARPGYGTAENRIRASWNGVVRADRSTADTTLRQYSFTVTGTGSDLLGFGSATYNTGLGTLLSLVAVTPADRGPQVEVTANDTNGWAGRQISTTGKFVNPSGGAMTITSTLGAVSAQPDGSFTWTYTPPVVATDVPVTVTAKDTAGRAASMTFRYTAVDGSPPTETYTLSNPPAASGWYSLATFDPTLTWLVSDPESPITATSGCAPQTVDYDTTGVRFTCTATSTGGTSDATSELIRRDATPPLITVPAGPVLVEAASPSGATSGFLVSSSDATSGPGAIGCDRPSGATFPLGDTLVTCTAADQAGNTATGSFTIRVEDTIAPVIAPTADRTVEATDPAGATVAFDAPTARDLVDGDVAVGCDRSSGETFALGTATVTCSAADAHGNVATASFDVTVEDTGNPTIDGAQSPVANDAGWNRGDVTVGFECADSGSGVESCEPPVTLRDETPLGNDGQLVTGNVADRAGNTAQTTVGPIRIDRTKPTLTGAATEPANALDWYRDDVTVAWDAQDGLSGVDESTVPQDSVITGEGKALDAGPQSVKDMAGNESETTNGPSVAIDRTKPLIEATTATDPNAAGWFDSAVTVEFACSDALSGVQECTEAATLADDGTGQSAAGTATDNAGNTADDAVTGIRIDSHAPRSVASVTCSGDGGYCKEAATVKVEATDPAPAAGVETSGVDAIEYRVGEGEWTRVDGSTAEFSVPLNGSGTAAIAYRAIDVAGNAEAANAGDIAYDTLAPSLGHRLTPEANANGWNDADTTVQFIASDVHGTPDDAAPSGLASVTPDRLVDSETEGTVVDGEAVDRAGNHSTDTVTVRLDKTAPAVEGSLAGTTGENGWWTTAVTARFACTDPGAVASGVETCTSDQVLHHGDSATGRAVDAAGNDATAAVGPVKVDTSGPRIDVAGVADGGVYTLGAVPVASCTATDVGASGVDGGCSIEVSGGLGNGVGTFAYVARARDVAGNATTVRGTFAVRYAVKTGTAFWRQPINDTAHTANATTSVFKGGSTVPAKFRLTDARGRVVQATTPPVWLVPARGRTTNLPVDESVYGAAANTGSTFAWSAADQQYQFNWGTPSSGSGYYWRIGVRLDDGTTQTVTVALR